MKPYIPVLSTALASLAFVPAPVHAAPAKPNIIFILTDDLGYGDVGVFYQNARRAANNRAEPWHLTPKLDTFAAEGLQIPQHYCPAPVCAPSRASFLLGVHQGHANVRNNQFDKQLENNHTVASTLKQAGYATAAIGKWGLQGKGGQGANQFPGHPQKRGFDDYFGYIGHGAGHNHYPKEDGKPLYEGDKDVSQDYDGSYTTDLFTARAKKWITDQKTAKPNQPFFLYLAYDTPHAKLQYPATAYPAGGGLKGGVQWTCKSGHMINTSGGTPDSYCYPDYANATWDDDKDPATPEVPWPEVYKRHASSVRRLDDAVGDLTQLLKDLKVDDNTLVIFTSDNGPAQESYLPQQQYRPNFFNSFGPFEGIKRDVWEGGLRVGALARWPKHIPAGRVSPSPSGFWDWLPTFTELAGVPAPARTDGVSLVPALTGQGTQKPSRIYTEYFVDSKTPSYQEFSPARRGRPRQQMQVLRLGDYVGVRYDIQSHADPFEIYNIVQDPKQRQNLADDPAYGKLQKELHDTVLGLRRPDPSAPRPYDDELIPAVSLAKTTPGLNWIAVEGATPWVAQIDGAKPTASGTSSTLSPSVGAGNKDQSILFSGYIEAPKDGTYTFSLTADSGALLRLHEATIIDADFGYRRGAEVQGTVNLKAGRHPIRLYYTRRKVGKPELSLKWSSVEIAQQVVPATALSH